MSDTPRTDAFAERYEAEIGRPADLWEFARQLELELRAAQKETIEQCAKVCDTSKIITRCGVSGAFLSGFEQARKLMAENIRALPDAPAGTK